MKIKITLALLIGSATFSFADDSLLLDTPAPRPAPEYDAPAPRSSGGMGKEVMAPLGAPSLGKEVVQRLERPAQKDWFLELGGGYAFGVSGDFTSDVNRTVNKGVFGAKKGGADVRLNSLSFDDAFGTAHTFSARIGRAVRNNNVYLRVAYTEADGGSVHLGDISNCDLYGDFGRYSDWGLLVGFERQFNQAGMLSPYIGFEAGVRFVDSVNVDLLATEGSHGASFWDVPFYDNTALFTAEFVIGIDYAITESFTIGIETGLRYQAGLDGDDSGLSEFGLEGLNNAGELLAIPVMLTGTLEF